MSAIETLVPVLAVLSITLAGVSALPWNSREVAESARAFGTLGRLSVLVVWRAMGAAALPRWWDEDALTSPGSVR